MGPAQSAKASSDAQASEVAERWIEAVNDRDVEALVSLADPSVEYFPTVLASGRRTYQGYQGLREWMADLGEALPVHSVRIAEVRHCSRDEVVVVGHLFLEHDPVSPFALRLSLSNGLVVEGHAYLSDDEILRKLGLTDT